MHPRERLRRPTGKHASAGSAASARGQQGRRAASLYWPPGVAAVRHSPQLDRSSRPTQPTPAVAPSAAVQQQPSAAVPRSRRPPPCHPSSSPQQQPSAAVAAAVRRGTVAAAVLHTQPQPSFFSRFTGSHRKPSRARLLSWVLTGLVPTRAGDRDVGTIWVRCGLVPGFAEPTNRARNIHTLFDTFGGTHQLMDFALWLPSMTKSIVKDI